MRRSTSGESIQVQKDDFFDEDPNKLLDAGVTVLLMDNIDKYGNRPIFSIYPVNKHGQLENHHV